MLNALPKWSINRQKSSQKRAERRTVGFGCLQTNINGQKLKRCDHAGWPLTWYLHEALIIFSIQLARSVCR